MGLWLKCPQCQAANPLDLKNCLACNASLENLPVADRVYILGDEAVAAPKTAVPPAAPAAPETTAVPELTGAPEAAGTAAAPEAMPPEAPP